MAAFLLLNGGAIAVALLVAGALGLGAPASRRLLGTLAGYVIVVHLLVLGAGLTGRLTLGGVGALLAGALVAAAWLAHRRRGVREPPRDRARFTLATVLAPLVAGVAGVLWTWPHAFEATRLWVWDDYTYHMVYPALWLREHAIAAAPPDQAFTMQAWYPLSASVVAAWFMLPFPGLRGDALAWVSLTGPLYAGIVASAAAELLGRVGCRPGAWAVPVVLFATSERITIMASRFSDADLAQAAALFGAFAFAVPRGGAESGHEVRVDALYAGLLSGLALGVKVSALPVTLVLLLMASLRAAAVAQRPGAEALTAAPRGRGRAVGVTVVVFATSWAAMAGYWYARNAVHTGNPMYPAAFLIWPGTAFPETTLREYSGVYGLRRTLSDALLVYMNWPRLHATLAVVGLLGLAGWRLARRRSMTRSQSFFTGGALAVAAIMLSLLPVAPYSAGNAMTFRSGFVHWDSMRYVALLPILGWTALGCLLDRGAGGRGGTPGAALAGVPLRPPPRFAGRVRTLAAAMAALVVTGTVVSSHGAKAAATTAAFYREPLFGPALAVLDRQPAGTRVAVFGDQWIYPTFGAAHHLVPVRLDRDGRVARTPIGDAMEPGNVSVDPATFRANLGASGVGLVVVVHQPHPGRSPDWPTQHAALEAVPGARLLHRDAAVAVWELDGAVAVDAARERRGAARPGPRRRRLQRRATARRMGHRLAEGATMRYDTISADCHLDLCWLPPDLFTGNASAAMKDRMPYVTDGPQGPRWATKAGANLGRPCGMGSAGREYVPGRIHRSDRMAETGLYDDGKRGIRRITDPELRLKDQDRDGVQGEVLYGVLGTTGRMNDPEAAAEVLRIYNEWLADFCATHPERYAGLASIPNHPLEAAIAEVERVARRGVVRGVDIANSSDLTPLWDPYWNPLWEVINATGLPLHFHTVGGYMPDHLRKIVFLGSDPTRASAPDAPKVPLPVARAAFASNITQFQINMTNILTSMIFSGVLEKYSRIRLVLGESGIGWIPYILQRMDAEWEDQFKDLSLTMPPSAYWRRQCKATFQTDPIGIKLLDDLGAENVMWGSDFPHPDGVWPDSQEYIQKELGHLPADARRKVVCENAGRFYGFPLS